MSDISEGYHDSSNISVEFQTKVCKSYKQEKEENEEEIPF